MGQRTPSTHPHREFRGTGLWWSLFAGAVLLLAILVAILLNLQSIEFRYIGVTAHAPLGVILLLAVVATALLTEIIGLVWRHRRRRQLTEREELRDLRARSVATPGAGAAAPSPVAGRSATPPANPPSSTGG